MSEVTEAVPEFEMKTGTKDTVGVYGGVHGALRAEVRHSPTEADPRQADPHPSRQACPLPTPWWRGPVDHSLLASSHLAPTACFLLPGSKRLGKWQRVNVVQSWDHGILTWERARFLSLQTLSGDWERAVRNPQPCVLQPLRVFPSANSP